MKAPTITYLPQAKIKYNYSTPSMSRRGGTRLHPIRDGVLNPIASQQTLRTRDAHGQKLRDVTDPMTGMYTHSVSSLESRPLNPAGCEKMKSGVSGSATGALKYLASSVRLDTHGKKVYLDDEGRRIRTVDMGETAGAAVPVCAAPSTTTRNGKRSGSVKPRATKSTKPTVPGGTGPNGRITQGDIESFIRATAAQRGVTITVFTPAMIQAGREALKLARRKAEIALQNAQKGATVGEGK